MQELINYQQCPCCASTLIQPVLAAKDDTVSQEIFKILHCNNCSLRFTQAVPTGANIEPYYQSINYVSHSDNKDGLTNKLYHLVRNYTLKSKLKLVQTVTGLTKGSLLDVGAGTGYFSQMMANNGWQVTSLEPDITARKVAMDKYNLLMQDANDLYYLQNNQFDAIAMWHVLEHVHDLHGYLTKFHEILKPNGQLIIAVPNYTSYDAEHYAKYWAAYDVPRHLYHFSPQSINVLAKLKGFTVKTYKPMWFDSFYVSMLSEQYKNGKGNLLSAVWHGLVSNLKALGDNKRCSSVIYVLVKN